MPDNVVTNILDRLPLQYVMRTSVLSKNWRFKWTMLSQLVFDDNFFQFLIETDGADSYGKIISRLLLNCAITKFVLYSKARSFDNEDISHWILFLSRKGIKDLTFSWKTSVTPFKFPTHIFSCLELKHLKLINCRFDPPTGFNGFPNLLSLELSFIHVESGKFGQFFTRSPILEILNLHFTISGVRVRLAEIVNLANLKILSLPLCNLDTTYTTITSVSSIFQLVSFLPKLQELELNFILVKLAKGDVNKRFHATLPCLKTLKLSAIDLDVDMNLSLVFEMIRSFKNLQTLEIRAIKSGFVPTPVMHFPEVDYKTVGQLQLRSVVFTYCKGTVNEVCLIKCLLACSPFLKKIVICALENLESNEKLMFTTKLLKIHRASPVAEVDVWSY